MQLAFFRYQVFHLQLIRPHYHSPKFNLYLHAPNEWYLVLQDIPGIGGEDAVTPLERRLYFSTAHYHLRAGCPALAVEVLSKLPGKIVENSNITDSMTRSKGKRNTSDLSFVKISEMTSRLIDFCQINDTLFQKGISFLSNIQERKIRNCSHKTLMWVVQITKNFLEI